VRLLALWQLNGPRASGVGATPSDFSSARALKHLEAIAARPRPNGSAAHAEARDYLLRELSSLGLTAEVQRVVGVSRRTGSWLSAGTVGNVLTRQKGTTAGPAVLSARHCY
jgi:acetylornithine deacetylase/succinyl-diaminopimelate desuccinylase-like protein